MAFPTLNAQQEINNRKILEDLQLKKQLLQKAGIAPVVSSINTPNLYIQSTLPSSNFQLDSTQNSSARTVFNQANSHFGFFIVQDSIFGNNILPVLPRFDNLTK